MQKHRISISKVLCFSRIIPLYIQVDINFTVKNETGNAKGNITMPTKPNMDSPIPIVNGIKPIKWINKTDFSKIGLTAEIE